MLTLSCFSMDLSFSPFSWVLLEGRAWVCCTLSMEPGPAPPLEFVDWLCKRVVAWHLLHGLRGAEHQNWGPHSSSASGFWVILCVSLPLSGPPFPHLWCLRFLRIPETPLSLGFSEGRARDKDSDADRLFVRCSLERTKEQEHATGKEELHCRSVSLRVIAL